MINVAVLGYGTVGSGVVEVIEKNKDMVNKKSAQELEVKYILDLRDSPEILTRTKSFMISIRSYMTTV